LHLSRSRTTRQYNKERDAEPATVLGVLYQFHKAYNLQRNGPPA
jgi:hypothetical protein